MPRHWTMEERRKFLRAKYFTRRAKVLCTIIFLLAVFSTLWLAIAGIMNRPAVQGGSMFIVLLIVVIFFLVTFGMQEYKKIIWALVIIGILVALGTYVIDFSNLGGVEQFIGVVALGLLFLLVLGVSLFMIDFHNFEGE